MGVRFINNFLCPMEKFNDYVHVQTAIKLNESDCILDGTSQNFMLWLKNKYQGLIFFMVNPVKVHNQTELNITFDIDVSKVFDEPMDIQEFSGIMREMRALKNDLFESNLSPELKKTFNPQKKDGSKR